MDQSSDPTAPTGMVGLIHGLAGVVDQVHLYDRTLTATEIRNLYPSGN